MKKAKRKSKRSPRGLDSSPYPRGWNRQRTQKVIDFYDHQTDDEAIAEAAAAYGDGTTSMMQIPNKLVPKIQKLLAKRAG